MLLATVCVGDTLVTLTKKYPIALKAKPVFNLRIVDMIDEVTADLEYDDEGEAFLALAAWIAADKPEAVVSAATELRDRMGATIASKLLP